MESIQQFRTTLPISEFKEDIINHVLQNIFIIVTGDTGSGKSTQLPQYMVDSEQIQSSILQQKNEHLLTLNKEQINTDKFQVRVAVTQPRRMAAISMAKRLAFERNQQIGASVGYTIRFDNTTSDQTIIRYMTDGILVRECLQDKHLLSYDIVILDEAHERSLYTDVLFALVKRAALARNGSLKVIVTSATLNVTLFKNYFNDCPCVKVHGKSFPVEVKFCEMPISGAKRIQESVTAALRMHLHEGQGDILVFLPGSEDCEMARKVCFERLEQIMQAGREVPNAWLYALYGSQTSEDQSQVFQRADDLTRKIIFCTNIAETSITIDNIGFVVDCGYVKQKVYNPRTGMDSLIVTPISKTQCVQRMGRAGRTQAGKCYRLYTKQFYDQMADHSTPEILRVNLASVLLLLKTMGIQDVMKFEFMEQPQQQAILQSLRQLYLLGAINENGDITPLGLEMARYPLEPSYSKCLISSKLFGCDEDMAIVVALLSTENVWQRITRVDVEGFEKLQKMQETLADLQGDHFTLLKIYKTWKQSQYSEQFVKDHLLHMRALKQAENIRIQLNQLIDISNKKKCQSHYENDHLYKLYKKKKKLGPVDLMKLALCTGFYFNTARRMHNSEDSYLMIYPEGTVVDMDTSSIYSIVGQYPETVIFTELGGTSLVRGVMRLVTEIDIEIVKPLFSMMTKVDLFRLAKMEFQQQGRQQLFEKRLKNEEEKKVQQEKDDQVKKEKLAQYIQNYQARKKQKK